MDGSGTMTEKARGEVTRLLGELSAGDRDALSQLLPLVYDELRRLASRRLHRERPGHPLQPTALVHEAYIRLLEQREVRWKNRGHFFAVAAQAMRRILIDQARAQLAEKRGGPQVAVSLDDAVIASEPKPEELIALDAAITQLSAVDPRQVQVVELRFFAGLTIEETAEALGISDTTVKREWRLARAWLHRAVERELGR
jgi:RNA polymerase sigma factor (TIGR02999 family)